MKNGSNLPSEAYDKPRLAAGSNMLAGPVMNAAVLLYNELKVLAAPVMSSGGFTSKNSYSSCVLALCSICFLKISAQ